MCICASVYARRSNPEGLPPAYFRHIVSVARVGKHIPNLDRATCSTAARPLVCALVCGNVYGICERVCVCLCVSVCVCLFV